MNGTRRVPSRGVGILLSAVALSALAGCEDTERPIEWEQTFAYDGPLQAGDALGWLNRTYRELWTLNDDGTFDEWRFRSEPLQMVEAGPGRLAVLTRRSPSLVLVNRESGRQTTIKLESAYDRVAISPDGRFALLHYDPERTGSDDQVVINANEMALIDLSESLPVPKVFSLRGPRPERVVFAPDFTLTSPDEIQRYAVVIARDAVSLLNLTTSSAENRQRLIRLAEPTASTGILPQRVLFSTEDPAVPDDLQMFVLTSRVPDIFAVSIRPASAGAELELDLSINQIATGSPPADMNLFRLDGRDKLLVTTAGRQEVAIVDVPTSDVVRVSLDGVATRAMVWDDGTPRALLYTPGTRLVFWADLSEIELQGFAAVSPRTMTDAIDTLSLVETGGFRKAFGVYSAGRGVAVLNLDDRVEIPLPANVGLGEFTIAGNSLYAVAARRDRLVRIDLVTQAPSDIELPDPGVYLRTFRGGRSLVVDHATSSGAITILDALDPKNGDREEIRGFFFRNLFEREF